jgi:O-antigen ligase
MFANYLELALPVTIAALWGRVRPALLVAGAAIAVVVAAFTLSSGFAGLLFGLFLLVAWGWRERRGIRTLLLAGLGVATVGAAAVLTFSSIAWPVAQGQDGDVRIGGRAYRLMDGARPSLWRAAAETFRSHPLLGIGYGEHVSTTSDPRAFVYADRLDTVAARGPVAARKMEAHNAWLNVAGQAGVLGLATFAFLLLANWVPVLAVARRPGEFSVLAAGLFAGFAGGLLYHGVFGALEETRALWALAALGATTVALDKARAPAARRQGARAAIPVG